MNNSLFLSPSAHHELMTMFPYQRGQRGGFTTPQDVLRYFRSHTFHGSFRQALDLIMRAALERYESYGKGNAAARKQAMIETHFEDAQDTLHGSLGVSEDDFCNDLRTEARIH